MPKTIPNDFILDVMEKKNKLHQLPKPTPNIFACPKQSRIRGQISAHHPNSQSEIPCQPSSKIERACRRPAAEQILGGIVSTGRCTARHCVLLRPGDGLV